MNLRGLQAALLFLTRLPVPAIAAPDADDLARATPWFPAAGIVVGIVVALPAIAGALVDPWVGALFGLVAWVWVTGGLHLDGLADLADARAAGHRDHARFLAVLKDPHIGAFGVIAIVLQLIAKLILLHGLAKHGALAAVMLVPAAARVGPVFWSWSLPPLTSGLGARCAGAAGKVHLALWSGLILLAALALPFIAASFLLIGAWWLYLKRRVGGVSGDCHGAGIELVESGLLAAATCALELQRFIV